MFGISQQAHDLIFSIGAFVLLIGLLPQIVKGTILPLSSCILTGGILLIFTLNYLTMEYWYVMFVEAANVVGWSILLTRAIRNRHEAPG